MVLTAVVVVIVEVELEKEKGDLGVVVLTVDCEVAASSVVELPEVNLVVVMAVVMVVHVMDQVLVGVVVVERVYSLGVI